MRTGLYLTWIHSMVKLRTEICFMDKRSWLPISKSRAGLRRFGSFLMLHCIQWWARALRWKWVRVSTNLSPEFTISSVHQECLHSRPLFSFLIEMLMKTANVPLSEGSSKLKVHLDPLKDNLVRFRMFAIFEYETGLTDWSISKPNRACPCKQKIGCRR